MSGFSIFLLIVAIIIVAVWLFAKYMLRESIVINKICQAANSEEFSIEDLAEARRLLELISNAPDLIKYDISGDSTILNRLTNELAGVSPSAARTIINQILEEHNNKVREGNL